MSNDITPLDIAIRHALALAPIADFPTVDALRREAAGLAARCDAQSRVIGRSRLGEPIDAYTIGSGSRQLVVVGGVHPNEPIGFRTVLELLRLLADDPAIAGLIDATWHIVPCIDPDGARLNESWFSTPSDRDAYFGGFYRPAPHEQVEWSFPFVYRSALFDRPIPETRALMKLFDTVRPDLFMGLHNSELGGVYYYLNRDDPSIVTDLVAIPDALGLSLDVGEPESAELVALGPAVFLAPLARERYDYLESLGLDPAAEQAGAGTADYLERYGSLTLIAELPYWTHPDAADTRGSGRPYDDVIAAKAGALKELHDELSSLWARAAPHLTLDTPFRRATDAFVPAMGALARAENARLGDPQLQREATVAEVFANEEVVTMFRLRFGGTLRRALEAEVVAGTASGTLRALHADVETRFAGWRDGLAHRAGIEPLPIERLVGVQLAALLVTALHLERRRE
jgi:hypothetical protein